MVDIAQRLSTLCKRPPTPPKDRSENIIDTSSPNGYFAHISKHILLDTPNESPSSSAEYFAGSVEKGTKKVIFSPWHECHKPAGIGGKSSIAEGNLRRLPPSRDCKSSRSILKPSTGMLTSSSPSGELPRFDISDFPKMIGSTMAHLRSASRTSRLDAYSALLGSLSAYDDLPDSQAMVDNLPDFLEHIRRDMSATTGVEKATQDTQLATQSLKLLTILLCMPILADSFPDDFSTYVLDKALSSIQDLDLPKIVIIHYMQVLAKQNFARKLMTNERVHRLLLIMKDLTDRVKGNSIIGLRLRIYGRLLIQAKHIMAFNATDWLDQLVSGMLSSTREIRSLAVAFGMDAGIALGNISSVSQAVFQMFDRKSPDGQTVAGFLTNRLLEMTTSKDDVQHVPQVWSAMILLLRNRRHQLERWLHLKPWLLVIQKCLNSSDARVKSLAMTGWNRLVLTINIDTTTGSPMINMLRQPVVSHLNRNGGDRTSKQIRQLAHSSYCNLLYYAFRPSATHAQLDLYWDQYVDQVLPESFSASKRDSSQACSILAALFHSSNPKPWEENRANTARFIKPEELPCIDPKWVRSRSHKIIKVLEKLVIPGCAHLANEEVLPNVVWQNFTMALGDASKQEVKVSIESMSAIAHILNFLTRYWNRTYVQQQAPIQTESSVAIAGLHSMIRQAIENIGAITFNEKRLLRSAKNQFEPAETPSSRFASVQGTLSSPTIHVLRLLISTIKDDEAMDHYIVILRCLLDTALHSASSRVSQLALLRELTDLVVSEISIQNNARVLLWQIIAEATEIAVTRTKSTDGSIQSPQHAGREFRDVTGILEAGICQPSASSVAIWRRLESAVRACVRTEVGNGGIVVAIVEPISTAINNKLRGEPDSFLLSCATSLMQNMTWLQSGQDIERARRLLWGQPIVNQRPSALNSNDNFCTMVDRILTVTYRNFAKLDQDGICALLEALAHTLGFCPLDARVGIMKRMQQGIACWLGDTRGVLAVTASDSGPGRISRAVRSLWSIVKAMVENMTHNSASLILFQELVTSSLKSRHRAIVNDAISLWNKTFGTVVELDYPEELVKTLARLRELTEIELPCFPEVENVDLVSSPFNFIETQETEEGVARCPTSKPMMTIENPAADRALPSVHNSLKNASLDASPSAKSAQRLEQRRISKTPQKVRLRHDDSQVEFAAIEMSSPLNSAAIPSQVVTDHQIEIKERQSREVAMFPQLGSSPQPLSCQTDRQLPRLNLSGGKHCHQTGIDADAQISPIFPFSDGTLESFLGSSPTPRRAMKNTLDRAPTTRQSRRSLPVAAQDGDDQTPGAAQEYESEAHEKIELEQETKRRTRILDAQCDPIIPDVFQEETSTPREEHRIERGDTAEPRSLDEKLVHKSANMEQLVAVSTRAPQQHPPENEIAIQPQASFPTPTSLTRARHDGRVIGSQTCLDLNERPTTPADDENTSRVTDSFQSQSSFYSNDDEQISAQLAADMERASSQARLVQSRPKRKRNAPDEPRKSKRAKGASRTQSCHVVVETRRPQDLGEDCIIIDTRNVLHSPRAPSPSMKRERSSSPGMLDALPVIEGTERESSAGIPASNTVTRLSRATSPSSSHSHELQKPLMSQRPSKRRSARLSEGSEAVIDSQQTQPKVQRPVAAVVQTVVDDIQRQDIRVVDQSMESAPDARANMTESSPVEATWAISPVQDQEESSCEHSKPKGSQNSMEGQDIGGSLLLQQQGCAASKEQSTGDNGTHPANLNEGHKPSSGHRMTTTQEVLEGFQKLLGDIKQVSFKAEDERSMVKMLFECVKEVHDAGRRHPER